MTYSISVVIFIFLLHWVADFVCQPYWMKLGKVRSVRIMLLHVSIYASVLFLGLILVVGVEKAFLFSLVNGILHLGVDLVSCRAITKATEEIRLSSDKEQPLHERVDPYGVVTLLGLDQLMHKACLLASLPLI